MGAYCGKYMIVISHEITQVCLDSLLFNINFKHIYETYIHSKKFPEDLWCGRDFGLCF